MSSLEVALRRGCDQLECVGLALREFETLNKPQYRRGVSIRVLTLADAHAPFAAHRTARKRVLRARRFGYRVEHVEPRDNHADMLAINTSLDMRQGRKMDEAYTDLRATTSPMPAIKCPWHHAIMYGVLLGHDHLVAYASIYRCGDLVHVSQFLGHGEHLEDGIMYLLMDEIIRSQARTLPCVLFYNRHDSGSSGLRFYKERVGLQSRDVTWTP